MKRIPVIFIISLFTVLLYADEPFFNYGFAQGALTFIFAENVRVRTGPVIKNGNVADTLGPGHEVRIIQNDEKTLTLNGICENWLHVKYTARGKEKTGYVWGALCAIAYTKAGNELVLAGIRKYSENRGLEAECRIVSRGKVISSLPVKLHYLPESSVMTYRYSVSMGLHDSKGLEGLSNVVSISCEYGACGYPYGNIWVGYSPGKLYYLGTDTSVSEAGVFHVEERFVFPSDDNRLKNRVIVVTESSEFSEELNDYKSAERKERTLVWKNFRLVEKPE